MLSCSTLICLTKHKNLENIDVNEEMQCVADPLHFYLDPDSLRSNIVDPGPDFKFFSDFFPVNYEIDPDPRFLSGSGSGQMKWIRNTEEMNYLSLR